MNGQPEDRDVPHVERHRPGHEHVLRDPLHFAGRELIVGGRQVAARDLAGAGVDAAGARVLGDVPPEEPDRRALREVGDRLVDYPSSSAGVVADPRPHQDLTRVEQVRLAGRVQDAAVLSVRDGVRLEHGALPLGQRLTLQQHPLAPGRTRWRSRTGTAWRNTPAAAAARSRPSPARRSSARARWAGPAAEPWRYRAPDRGGCRSCRRRVAVAAVCRRRRPDLRLRGGRTEPQTEQHQHGDRGPAPPPMHDDRPCHAHLVEQDERCRHHQHREEVGARRQHGPGNERQDHRVAPEPASSAGPTTPSQDRMMMMRGSSKDRPSASTTWSTKPK